MIDSVDARALAWLRGATARDVAPRLVHQVERLVREGVAEWLPDRVVVVDGRREKRKRARALPR